MNEAFTCTRGQLTIRGEAWHEAGSDLPIIIISHGFMANMETCRDYAKQMAATGWAAFIYDFCGGCLVGKSDGATTDMSVLTEREDLKAVLAYAKAQAYTDASRVVLMGCSQGGFVSALTGAQLGDAISALVLFYPALCIPDDARRGQMIHARFDPKAIPETFSCGPMLLGRCYAEAVIDMDPNKEISAYQGPVLLVHGTADGLVPYSYSVAAAKAYANAELVPIEGADHGFRGAEDVQAMDTVRAFLARVVG